MILVAPPPSAVGSSFARFLPKVLSIAMDARDFWAYYCRNFLNIVQVYCGIYMA
jgi:hypothetical protein